MLWVCVCVSVLGKIRSAVGSAQLLMSQKFQQFYWLCQQNLVRDQRREGVCVYVCPNFIFHNTILAKISSGQNYKCLCSSFTVNIRLSITTKKH